MEKKIMSMEKVHEFSKSLLRKIRRLDYDHVPLPDGYEEAETKYKALRDGLLRLSSSMKRLENYEHGNRFFKNIKMGIEYINDRAFRGPYKSKDMYEQAASAGTLLSSSSENTQLQIVASKYRDAFKSISDSKKKLNEKLAVLRVSLKDIKTRIHDVDLARRRVKAMRYDLELVMRDEGYNNELKKAEKKEYESQSTTTNKMMIEFVEDTEVSNVLSTFCREYAAHMEEASKILEYVH